MKVLRSAYAAGRWAPGSVAAIGKFDGLHRGHRRVLAAASRRARALRTKCLVLTFDPLPSEFFGANGGRLLPQDELYRELAALGVDGAVILPFDGRLACLSPEAFARDILARGLKVLEVVVGEDFCYGRERSGRVDDLREQGRALGFLVRPVPILKEGREKVSSSLIRRLVAQGRRADAERLLGRPIGGKDKKKP